MSFHLNKFLLTWEYVPANIFITNRKCKTVEIEKLYVCRGHDALQILKSSVFIHWWMDCTILCINRGFSHLQFWGLLRRSDVFKFDIACKYYHPSIQFDTASVYSTYIHSINFAANPVTTEKIHITTLDFSGSNYHRHFNFPLV